MLKLPAAAAGPGAAGDDYGVMMTMRRKRGRVMVDAKLFFFSFSRVNI